MSSVQALLYACALLIGLVQAASKTCPDAKCNSTLSVLEEKTEFASPCYSNPYPNDLSCKWNFPQHSTNNFTQITLHVFNLEAWYDYLKFDGPKDFIIFYNATNMEIIITGYPSGNISADFITDSGISYEGFDGSYSAVSLNALLDQYTGYLAGNVVEVLKSPMYLSSNENTGGSVGLNIMLMNIPNTTNSPSAAWKQYAELVGGSSGIHITDITATGFTANWTKIDGVQSYTLEISLPNGTAIKPEQELNHTTTIVSVTDLPSGSLFKLTLTAKNKLGSSETLHGNASTGTTVPVNIQATQIVNNSFILRWDAIPGALEYRIEIAKNGTMFQSGESPLSDAVVSGLQAGEQYEVRVNARFPVGEGNGTTISVITAPEKVAPVVENVTTTEVTLSWPPVKGAMNYSIIVMKSVGNNTETVIVSGSSKTVSGLNPGATYTFNLRAKNKNAIESQKVTIKEKTKLIPESASVQLDNLTSTSLTVSWPNIIGAASYDVRITYADGTVIPEPDVNAEHTYKRIFNGLQSGSRYNITLTAIDEEGGSHDLAYDGVANTETKQVDGIKITEQTQTKVKIGWTLVRGATLYKINVLGEGIQKDSQGDSIDVEGLQAGETYNVTLHAVFPIGDGPITEISVITVPEDVKGLKVANNDVTTTSVVPKWTDAKGADSYLVVLKIGHVVEVSIPKAKTGQIISVAQPGTTYTLSVQAKNTAGSSTAATTTFTTRLDAPENLEIVGIAKNRFVLQWSKVAGATSYQYNCTGGNPKEGSVTENTTPVNGLDPSSTYECSVFAKTSDMQSLKRTTTANTIEGFCNKDTTKPTCLHDGECDETNERCHCTAAYEGNSCERVKDWCSAKTCAQYSRCINDRWKLAAVCECKDGFEGDPEIRCQAFCEQETVPTDSGELQFNRSQSDEAVYSTQTCEEKETGTDRPKASAVCTVDIKNGKIRSKKFDKIVVVSCELKIANVTIKIDEGTTNVSTAELETQTAKLQVLTSGSEKIAKDDVEKVADYMEDVAKIADTKSDAVTEDVLTSMVNTANNLIKSKSIALEQTSPTVATPASPGTISPTQSPEETARQKEKEIKKKILKSLTKLAEQVIIPNDTKEIVIETPNMVVKVVEREANDTGSTSFAPAFLAEGSSEDNDTVYEQPLKITIPASAINKAKGDGNEIRISFFLHKDASLFPSSTTRPPEMIIAASLGKNVTATHLEDPIEFQYNNLETKTGETDVPNRLRKILTTPECSFWDFGKGDWSGTGCCLDPDDISKCRCDHLTNFARVVSDKEVPADVALETVCDVGLILSMVGLVLTIIIHCLKEDIRKRRPTQILMHICANLLVSYIVFFVAMSTPAVDENKTGCIAVAAIMQFVFLASWCWMAVYAYDMYRSLVLVFNVSQSRYMTKCTLFGYGVPLLITLIDAAVSVGHFDANAKPLGVCDSEGGYNNVSKIIPIESAYIADNMCWLHGYSLYFGFLLPVGIVLVFNIFVYSMVLRTLTQRGKTVQSSAKQTSAKDNLLISITLSASTGLTWVVAYLMLLSEDETYLQVTSWIFAVLNTVQGLVIFLTTCVRHENMRKVWLVPLVAYFSRFGSRIRMLSPKRDEFNIQAMSETGGSSYLSTNADNSTKATTAKSYSEKDMNSESHL